MSTQSPELAEIAPLLEDYQPSAETAELIRDTQIALLVGVSGAGKDTIKDKLLETGNYHHIVSHTTRPPRSNNGKPEIDGEDYHFVNLSDVEAMLRAGKYIEAKQYSGNIYGTTTTDIQFAKDHGKVAITTMEVQGVAEYLELSENLTPIFVLPPSIEVWRDRTLGRGESNAVLERLKTAPVEIQTALDEPRYAFVINDDLDETVAYVRQVIEVGQIDEQKQVAGRELAQLLLQEIVKLLR